jgi:hypothetical protein
MRWRARASRAHRLALGGQQGVQLAHLALVAGAGAFGPNVVVHRVEGDGELHPVVAPYEVATVVELKATAAPKPG